MMNLFNRSVARFETKSGKKIEIFKPSMDRLDELLIFVNRLVKEDSYLNLTGKTKTKAQEEKWLEDTIASDKAGRTITFWAVCGGKIVGSVDVRRGYERDYHVGTIGLMVDQDFRRDGIGRFLLEYIVGQAQKMGIRIVTLTAFADNDKALNLYKKTGFEEWGRLPEGLYRKGKYSDLVKMYRKIL